VKEQPVTNIPRQWLRNIDLEKGEMCWRGYLKKVRCPSQQLECDCQNGRTLSGIPRMSFELKNTTASDPDM